MSTLEGIYISAKRELTDFARDWISLSTSNTVGFTCSSASCHIRFMSVPTGEKEEDLENRYVKTNL